VISDLAGRILHSNPAMTSLMGYTGDELREMRVGQLGDADAEREREVRLGNEVLAGSRDSFQIERSYRHKNGEEIRGLLSIAMVRNPEGVPALIIGQILDITRQKELEREVVRAERLRTAGRLASGVAHDFNNLITVILGELDVLRDSVAPEAKASLENIREICAVGARMNDQLMAFSRDGVVELEVVDARSEIEAAARMLRALSVSGVSVDVMLPAEPLNVEVNPTLFEQMLLNLGNNARHAMPEGGKILIHAYPSEQSVCVDVSDTGRGMPPEVLERVFEPFYSTRKERGGTGLGMATVYGNMKRFGGDISIKSEVGKGTVVSLSFPRQGNYISVAPPRSPSEPVAREVDAAAVLVVDDQEAITDILERVLGRAGYSVTAVAGLSEVRELLNTETCPAFEILLTDMNLKDGTGVEVRQAFLDKGMDASVLFVSGYNAGVLPDEVVLGEGIAFLRKPFEPVDVLAEVMRLMDGRHG